MISHDQLAQFSAFLWPALAEHLWQATLVAGLCLLALPAFCRAGAKARHLLWALAFVRFVIPQAVVLFIIDHFGFHLGFDSAPAMRLQRVPDLMVRIAQPSILVDRQAAAASSVAGGHPEIYCILTIIWIAGFLLILGRWWFRQHKFARLLQTAGDAAGTELMHTLESLKHRLGFRWQARLRVAWQGSEPGVYGVWSPILVLPKEMPQQLCPAEVEAVLAHELVHVARRDNLWINLQMLVCCIFWFYPIVWLLDRRLIAERERSCDERVIGALRNSQAYVSGLIKITRIGLGLRVTGVSSMAGANLKRRIENMKQINRKSGLSARILLPSVAGLAFLLYLVAAPIHGSIAQAASSNITIENCDSCPLKIVSASITDIAVLQSMTENMDAQLIDPKILLKNSSNKAVSVYTLEFRKTGSLPVYLWHMNKLASGETETLGANIDKAHLYVGTKIVTDADTTWTVRLVSMFFEDGSYLTTHNYEFRTPSPRPKIHKMLVSSGKLPGGIIGGGMPGQIQDGKNVMLKGPVSPPPSQPSL